MTPSWGGKYCISEASGSRGGHFGRGQRTCPGKTMPKRLILLDFLGVRTHSSRHDDALHKPRSQAGHGRGRSPSIILRISANNWLGTATSAIWKVTERACVTIFAPILTSFSRRLVSDQCLTASGNTSVRMKLARL